MPTRHDAPNAGARLIRRALRHRRRAVLGGVGAALVYQGAFLVIPLVTGRAVDELVAGATARDLLPYVAILIGLAAVRAVAGAVRKYLAGVLGAGVGADLRGQLYQHLQRMSFSFHDRLGTGQLMSRASSDITAIEAVVAMVPFTIQSLVLGVGGAVLLVLIDPLMAAVVVCLIALTAIHPIRLGRPIHERSRTVQDLLGDLSTYIDQQIHGMEVVKGHGSEATQVREGRTLTATVHDAGIALTDLRAAFQTSFGLAPSLAAVAVLGLGGWLSLRGRLTAGELFAFIQYLGMLMAPVGVLATALGLVPQGIAAGERVAEVLGAEPEIVSPQRPTGLPPDGRGHVRFEGVTFGYRDEQPVLVDLDLDLPPGSSVALVGPSGSGKSTLALLIARFYDPWEGTVRLDGVPVDRVDLAELRLAVAMVFEDTVVLNTTVRHNLAMARPTASTAQIVRAAELARADGFIRQLPDGYDTLLGDEGVGLSGGQRQRLSIARAILRDPRVLVLDDATSAVDPATDADIRESLAEVMRGRTTIIVAHRLETLALADRVLLLDNGRVLADGTHEELLQHAVYREALALHDAEAIP